MDIQALHVALQASFSADASIRGPAENTIKNLKHVPGSTVKLLQVAAERQVQYEVRQAAAINVKNIIRECWNANNKSALTSPSSYTEIVQTDYNTSTSVLLNDADKAMVRVLLTNVLLLESEKSIRDLLAEAMYFIAINDFPELWPELLPTLVTTIAAHPSLIQHIHPNTTSSSPTHLQVHNALFALHRICKRYEYKPKDKRGPLLLIIDQSFPLLLPMAHAILQPTTSSNTEQDRIKEYSIESALILKQILKIFWSATQFYLPGTEGLDSITMSQRNGSSPTSSTSTSTITTTSNTWNHTCLVTPEGMQPWLTILLMVLSKPLPEQYQPTKSLEERSAWPWWKVKKRACQIVTRLFSRYGYPKYAEDEVKEFSHFFSNHAAPQFLGPICELLSLRPRGMFCPDRVVHFALSFVDLSIELAPTYKLLKPGLNFLMYNVCFPTICLNAEDLNVFTNDPHEFIQRQNSPLADFYDPRMSAISVINNLVKHRGKDVSGPLLSFLNNILQGYDTARRIELAAAAAAAGGGGENVTIPSSLSEQHHIHKEGALLIIGSLSTSILSKKKFASEVEMMMVTSIFPEFRSPVGFLRYRACSMIEQFHDVVKWSDDGTRLRTLIHLVLQRLTDSELPVQIEASKALRFLIQSSGAEETLLPVLPQILNEYFRIMNEIGNDEVVSALQALIDKFGDHIQPHAIALVTQLATAFLAYCEGSEDDDEAAMAAAQCLDCITTVLSGVSTRPDIYKALEPRLISLITFLLNNDGEYIEYFENAIDILNYLAYFGEDISNELWSLFPLVYLAFNKYASDYLNIVVGPLDNFISKAPEKFVQGMTTLPDGRLVRYIDVIFMIVATTLSAEDKATESDIRFALSLFMTILHNCKGMIDSFLSPINDLCLDKLGKIIQSEIPLTRISIFEVIASALYYNPELELIDLEKRGVTHEVFMQWMNDMDYMDKWLPRKLTVLGLTSILQVPVTSLPHSISHGLPQLIAATAKLSLLLKEDLEKEEAEDDMEEKKDDEEDEEDFEGYGEDEDVHNQDDDQYMDTIEKLKKGSIDDMAKFLIGEVWDGEDEEEDFSSPIDDVDQLAFFSDTLRAAFLREPEAYHRIQESLSPDIKSLCHQLFIASDLKRAENN